MNLVMICKSLLAVICSFLFISMTCVKLPEVPASKPEGKIYEGFVVTTTGDTLHGQLQMISPTQNQIKIKFIDKEVTKIYKAKDLQKYSFNVIKINRKTKEETSTWINYTKKQVERPPVPFGGTEVLLQQLVGGDISLYNYYIENRTENTMEHIIYIEKAEQLQAIDKSNYKKLLQLLMDDKPEMLEKIGTKGYTFKFLENTIAEYNEL